MEDQTERRKNKNNAPLLSNEKAALKNEIYKHLQLSATSGGIWFFPGGKKGWLPWTVAAAVLLMFVSTIVYFSVVDGRYKRGNEKIYADATALGEIRTGDGEMKKITLNDSTVVMLNANSILRYGGRIGEGSSREVELRGNAFFSVKKDRHAPFIIHAHSLAVTVLGTELNVNARSAATEVALASGKVKVQQLGNSGNVSYLQPGEQIKLDTASQSLLKVKTDPSLYSAWTKGEWNFEQTTLETITGLISQYYGTKIIFNNPASKRLRINAVLPVSTLESLVSVIERTLRIKITVEQNQLIVQ